MGNFLTVADSLGGISTGALLGALITAIVNHYLSKSKAIEERQSNLQKEIFFNLQKHAENIFIEINLMRRQAEEIIFWLAQSKFTMEIITISPQERLNRLSAAQVYFSEEGMKTYEDTANNFRKIAKIYTTIGKANQMTAVQHAEIKSLLKDLNTSMDMCRAAIFKEINLKKNSV